ncbi:MAG: hypothetical protein D6807_00555, partial [Alphaproteobacteria bacterium]
MKDILDQVIYYLGALWRRRWLVFGTVWTVAAVGWAAVVSLPNQYESSARIYVDTATVLGPLLKGVAVESDLNRQVQVMRQTLLSRPNLDQLVRMTDLDVTAPGPAAYEALINRLEDRIDLTADKQNLFTISFTDKDPRLARDVVQALTTIFVENNLGENRSDIDNAQQFLRRQIAEYEKSLDAAESALAKFKQDNMEFLPGQSGLAEKLASAKGQKASLEAQLEDARKRVALLEDELAKTPRMLGDVAVAGGPPTNIEAQIVAIQAQLAELRARYTDEHPDVVVLKRRLENLLRQQEARISAATGGPNAGDTGGTVVNPVYSDLRIALVEEKGKVTTLEDQVRRAAQQVAQLERRIRLVPEVEAKMKKLTRDYEVIRQNYETLRSRLEAARISADRDEGGNRVNFRIIEAASLPALPSGPPRALFLIAVLFASLVAGGGVSWLLAVTQVTYGSVDHLKRDFPHKVIGVIGMVMDDKGRRRHRREIILLVAGSALGLLALFTLLFLESRYGLVSVRALGWGLCLIPLALGLG